ncbi:hypothetical protein R1flu_010261 [Riccia fluitans]|uniref:Uncharacterized protein n=1 Tax=Riccia fluitans TaxID=41844 RepID=A0ABD1Z4H5_9MARC
MIGCSPRLDLNGWRFASGGSAWSESVVLGCGVILPSDKMDARKRIEGWVMIVISHESFWYRELLSVTSDAGHRINRGLHIIESSRVTADRMNFGCVAGVLCREGSQTSWSKIAAFHRKCHQVHVSLSILLELNQQITTAEVSLRSTLLHECMV